jgi:hypothetical protein
MFGILQHPPDSGCPGHHLGGVNHYRGIVTDNQAANSFPKGFLLRDRHAGVACKSNQHKKLERPTGVPLCRYITRPAIAEQRLSLASNGNVIIACIEERYVAPC